MLCRGRVSRPADPLLALVTVTNYRCRFWLPSAVVAEFYRVAVKLRKPRLFAALRRCEKFQGVNALKFFTKHRTRLRVFLAFVMLVGLMLYWFFVCGAFFAGLFVRFSVAFGDFARCDGRPKGAALWTPAAFRKGGRNFYICFVLIFCFFCAIISKKDGEHNDPI